MRKTRDEVQDGVRSEIRGTKFREQNDFFGEINREESETISRGKWTDKKDKENS